MIRKTALGLNPAGGLGLSEHIKRFISLAWPHFYHHRWNELIREEVCRSTRSTTTIFGSASSQKTGTAAVLMLSLYWALSDQFTAICSTTTLPMLDVRIWGEVKKRFKEARERYSWLPGHLTESMRRICSDAKDQKDGRDFRNGVIGVACVKSSGEWQGLASYSGLKNRFVMLVGDELHVMEGNFLQGVSNLKSNPNFMAVYMGNLVDLETPLGAAAEPACGWDAFPDSKVARAYDLKSFSGRGVQLVGEDSPNLDFPAGQEPYHGLIGRVFLNELKHDYGEGTPLYIAQAGGGIPRSSLANRILTKEVCNKFGAFESVTWGAGKLTKLYSMDVSYTLSHGDKSVGLPLAFGEDVEGKTRLAALERAKVFKIPRLEPGQTVEDSLALQAKEEMDRLEIPYANFFFDGTGRSSFTAAAMRAMGTTIQPVEFGGRPSERPNFMGRKWPEGPDRGTLMPCSRVFDRFVTELWFAWRYVIEAGQFRALPEDVAKDGYLRLWFLAAGNKMAIEPKASTSGPNKRVGMKERIGRSPDHGDTLVAGIEGARRLGFVIGAGETRNSRGSGWLKQLRGDYEKQMKEQELSYA